MVDGAGRLRPHWRGVLGVYGGLADELPERAQRLERAAAEEGVASVLPGSDRAASGWRCDPLPLPLPARAFAELEAGLAQRARLIEAVLADIYGPQRLLAERRVPAALLFASPCFLRPCRDLAQGVRLHGYAADLVRGGDGGWAVRADITGGAAGLGMALHNRRLLARVLPEPFRPAMVRDLHPFMELWQDSLHRLAPRHTGNPAVVLLTPGVADPDWFEHMLLARELACTLAEPGDLTVRGGAVFLKTLQGLRAVDVVLRRVAGHLLDPLELDAGAGAGGGVPGLLDAARAGAVRIVNHPGNEVAEQAGFAALLAELAPVLLGEALRLPSAPDLVSASLAPCLDGSLLVPRPVVLRVFLVHDGTRWQAMPGGLARVPAANQPSAGAAQGFGLCKDVWVISEDRNDIVGPPSPVLPPLALRRSAGELPSRVADNLYWLGRSVERLDRGARLVRAAAGRAVRGGAVRPHEVAELECLLRCLVDAGLIDAEAASADSHAALAGALRATVREGRAPGAVVRLFDAVARLTESVRDRLTGDMYATFTAALRVARAETAASGRDLDALAHALAAVQRYAAAVAGMAAENMVRGGGFLFLDLGRRVERAQAVAAEVAAALDQPPPRIEAGLRLVLELCDSAITYRGRYLTVIQPAPVLDLVLADQGNPRGLAFQLAAMHTLLDELAGDAGEAERLAAVAAGLLAEVEALVADVLAAPDQAVAAAAAPARLRRIGSALAALSDRIGRRYFTLLPAARTVGWGGEEA